MTEDYQIPGAMEDVVANDYSLCLSSLLLHPYEQAIRLRYLVVDLNEQWDVHPHTSRN